MKKSLIALAVSGLAVASVNAAPQANSFYVGAKAGWASFHNDVNQLNTKYVLDERYDSSLNIYSFGRNSVTYGVFGGYQVIDNLAVELGYDYFGGIRAKNTYDSGIREETFRHSAHGIHLSLKPSYEVVKGLDVYGKVGAALVRNDYKLREFQITGNNIYWGRNFSKSHVLKTSLILGGGVEYAITPALALRLDYQWLNRVGNANKAARKEGYNSMWGSSVQSYSPSIHSVSMGLSYRFGQGVQPVAAPEIVTKNFAFSSDVLFDFGKANLKPAASAALDAAHSEINSLGLDNAAIQVAGYTDRIGSEASNLKLSQRRAESVANYIVAKGVNPANVTATGYGKANPVTGSSCDAVKGRKALIACLAPDRRVEIQVQGSKQVEM